MTRNYVPTTKRDKIAYLLDHWDDIYSPPLRSNGGGGSGGPALLPGMSRHHSVVELARCLSVLHDEAPAQHAHLKAFHTAEWRVHTWVESRKRKNGKTERVTKRERQRVIPAWVDNGKVRRGEQRLCDLFRGSVHLPEELEDALTLSNAEIEEKQRRRRLRLKSVAA